MFKLVYLPIAILPQSVENVVNIEVEFYFLLLFYFGFRLVVELYSHIVV